jgi:hypothetical protein
MNVDPLNPMGGSIDWSNPPPPPSAGLQPAPPPATSPGQPTPRPGLQPTAPSAQKTPQTPAPPSTDITAQLQQEIDASKAKTAQLDQLLQQQQAQQTQASQQFQSALADRPAAPAPETFNQQLPQPDAQQMMKTAPLLTVLAALGGKLTKMSGLTMIKATNAMISGQIAGNQQAYQDAKKTYDAEWEKFQDRQKQKLQIYKDQLEAWKDTYTGREKAWIIANQAVGDTITQAKNVQTHEDAILRAQVSLMQKKKAQQQQADDLKWFKAGETSDANARKIEATIPRLEMADETIKKVQKELPALIADLKKSLGPAATTNETIGNLIKKYSSDPRVGEFVARVNALKTALIGIEASGAGTMRSNQFIQQIFAKTAPDLFSQSAAQIQEATSIDAKMINSAYTKAKDELSREKSRAEFARGRVKGLQSGETSDEGGDIFSQADEIIGK